MELPFLKNKSKNQGGVAPTEREPDSSSAEQMLDGVAGELIDAYDRKDRAAFVQAMRALVPMLKDEVTYG